MAYKGIDVSKWNGDVDFKKVKAAGIDFVMIRAGLGSNIAYKDKKFEQNYKNAKAAGLHVGAYWYSYATTAAEATAEAAVFLKVVKGKKFDYPLAFDIEEQDQFNLGTAAVDKLIKTFCGAIEKAGYYCTLYSYEYFLLNRTSASTRKRYDIWCGCVGRKPKISVGIHQYSFTGKVNGCKTDVDLDTAYKNYPAIIKGAGLNGYNKSTSGTTAATTTTKYKTHTVVKGDCLWQIAQDYLGDGNRYEEIKALNSLKSNYIYAGQKLKIPIK